MAEEDILKKFSQETIKKDSASEKRLVLGLTDDQEYEFNQAFAVIAGDEEVIRKDQISAVLNAVGFTVQDWDIEEMIATCVPDDQGKYSCDTLVEAFEVWMKNQITADELITVFNHLSEHGVLPRKIEKAARLVAKGDISHADADIILTPMLNEMFCTDAGNRLKVEDIRGVIEEISSQSQGSISIDDFLRIFSTA